jgi:hypothetical protein
VPAGSTPLEHETDHDDPRPPLMPGTPDITAPDDEFAHNEAQLRLDEGISTMIDALTGEQSGGRDAVIEHLRNNYLDEDTPETERKLIDALTAWSFVHAKDLHERIKPFLEEKPGGGGAAPFGKAARPRRRLVFGKSDPFFSSHARSLGL